MDDLNRAIQFTRNAPHDKWESDKYKELYKTRYQDARKRLEKFKEVQDGRIKTFSDHGVPETDVEVYKLEKSNEYIQLLEEVIKCKKQIEWMDRGLKNLISDKILLLESML